MVTTALTESSEERIENMLEQNRNDSNRQSSGGASGDDSSNDEHNNQENDDRDFNHNENSNGDNSEGNNVQNQSSVYKGNEKLVSFDSCKSDSCLDDARCSESIPSSDSNKENINSNLLPPNIVEFDPSEYIVVGEHHSLGEYDNTDQIPLPQLLKMHVKQLVSGFEFGEATKRRAQENMKTARDRKKSECRKSEESTLTEIEKEDILNELENKPCCSKTVSEVEHKTPHSRKRQRLAESKMIAINADKDFCKATRRVPDCLIDHPDCIEVWVYMIYKEEAALKLRNPRLFNDFKSVTPRMRAILLDWLMEVAAVYHLRRVTYYLSVDYFDRFLSIRPDIPKSLLQLVGITCLYIAAKVEEIYPPNLSEFSYVCDGACKSNDMVSCELLILNSLGWEVVLTTPSDWLNLYMQLHFKSKDVVRTSLNMDFNKDFIFPQYSAYQFTRASQLMDLLSLDPGFLKFGYSVIAASAMHYMYGQEVALSVSGLSLQQLKPCVDYMEAFFTIIEDSPDPRLHSCLGGPQPEEINRFSSGLLRRIQNGPQNENYSFQTHVASMEYFEKATIYRLTKYTQQKLESQLEKLLDEVSDPEKPETPDSVKGDAGINNENESEDGTEIPELSSLLDDSIKDSGSDDLKTEELTKSEDSDEQNLMSLDEIFELILSEDDVKSTNSD